MNSPLPGTSVAEPDSPAHSEEALIPDPTGLSAEKPVGMTPEQTEVLDEIAKIHDQLALIVSHRVFQVYNSLWKLLLESFIRGVVTGLGTVIGATLVVSLLVYLLSRIAVIPILGEWAREILQEIQRNGTLP